MAGCAVALPPLSKPSMQLKFASGVDLKAWMRRAAAPVCLVALCLHLLLTCASWRYSAPMLMLDMSPSMLLASLALIAVWPSFSTSEPVPSLAAAGREASSVTFAQHDSSSTATVSGRAQEPVGARTTTFGLVGRLARKLAQAVAGSGNGQQASRSQQRRGSAQTAQGAISSKKSLPKPFWRLRARGNTGENKWAPSMSRIMSGQHLLLLDDTSSSVATSVTSRRQGERLPAKEPASDLPLVPHMGHLAVDCMHHDTTLPHSDEVTQVITTQHLLQFGALLGESSAELALTQGNLPRAMGRDAGCLLGATDDESQWAQGWEQVACEVDLKRGLHYCAWRRYLRKGLYVYKARTVFDGVSPQQLVAFQLDLSYKCEWDDACTDLRLIAPPKHAAAAAAAAASDSSDSAPVLRRSNTGAMPTPSPSHGGSAAGVAAVTAGVAGSGSATWSAESSFARSAYLYAKSRFPTPMASREYVYARRMWAKADDGGMYMLSRAASHAAAPLAGGRTVRVTDFTSGTVVRASALGDGQRPAAEMVSMYFEDSHVSAGFMNLGVRKALWPMTQKVNDALRKHVMLPRAAELQVAASAAFQQACFQPAAGAAPLLRRCVSVAAPDRASLDAGGGNAGDVPVLQQTVSVGPGLAGVGGVLVSRLSECAGPVVLSPAQAAARALQRFAALLAALVGVIMTALRCSRVARALRQLLGVAQAATAADRHARVESHPVNWADFTRPSGTGNKNRWGKRLAQRLALVAVRAVSLPLAHRVLSRNALSTMTSEPPTPSSRLHRSVAPSDTTSVDSSHGGTSRMALHGGLGGVSGTQVSRQESAARVRHWLDPAAAASQSAYYLSPHPDLMQHHAAMAQLQHAAAARRPAPQRPAPGGVRGPALGLAVVDGAPLVFERAPVIKPPTPPTQSRGSGSQQGLGGNGKLQQQQPNPFAFPRPRRI